MYIYDLLLLQVQGAPHCVPRPGGRAPVSLDLVDGGLLISMLHFAM